jgi:hypothetical protein
VSVGRRCGIGANDHQILLFARFFLQLPKNRATMVETTASIAMRITSIIGPALDHNTSILVKSAFPHSSDKSAGQCRGPSSTG